MLVDRPNVLLEQLGHHLLREPDGFPFDANLDARLSVVGLVEQEFARTGWHKFAAHDFPPLRNPNPLRLARIVCSSRADSANCSSSLAVSRAIFSANGSPSSSTSSAPTYLPGVKTWP